MTSHFFTTEISDPRFEADGLRHITVKSKALGQRGDITVFVPEGAESRQNLAVVVLLHGVYGSHWVWSQKAGVHLTARRLIGTGAMKPMILAMPSDGLFKDGSGYLPHREADYERWIAGEVPRALEEVLPCVSDRSDFFITGLSMGGYGAMRLGARYPHIFKAFSGHSSLTEFGQLADFYEPGTFEALADAVTHREPILDSILRNKEKIGPFRFDCGADDALIEANRKLHTSLKQQGIPHIFEELPGSHEWSYWERNVSLSLLFFDEKAGVS